MQRCQLQQRGTSGSARPEPSSWWDERIICPFQRLTSALTVQKQWRVKPQVPQHRSSQSHGTRLVLSVFLTTLHLELKSDGRLCLGMFLLKHKNYPFIKPWSSSTHFSYLYVAVKCKVYIKTSRCVLYSTVVVCRKRAGTTEPEADLVTFLTQFHFTWKNGHLAGIFKKTNGMSLSLWRKQLRVFVVSLSMKKCELWSKNWNFGKLISIAMDLTALNT